MAIFARTIPTETNRPYQKYREQVRNDFHECCAYCLLSELVSGGRENFELDHFKPKSLPEFNHLVNDFSNLYYACHPCNHLKSNKWPTIALANNGYRFFDPCKEKFSQHFNLLPNGTWQPLTKVAQYTEEQLRLNRKHLCVIRKLLNEIATLRGVNQIDWDTPTKEAVKLILTGDIAR